MVPDVPDGVYSNAKAKKLLGWEPVDKLERFTVKVLGAADADDQDLGGRFEEIAEYIEEGIAAGGIAVHCAAGPVPLDDPM